MCKTLPLLPTQLLILQQGLCLFKIRSWKEGTREWQADP